MEPLTTPGSPGKAVLFWVVFGLGAAVLAFAVLLTQTPGEDRTFDAIMLSIAGIIVLAALVMARLRAASPGGWRLWPLAVVVMGGELLICAYALISVLTYRGR